MTKDVALQSFMEGFGLSAYPSSSVPEDTVFPWLTYTPIFGAWEDGETNIEVNLWYRTESERIPNAKAQEISQAIGMGGVKLKCDEGIIWLKRGLPFVQSLSDETDDMIKRRYINISAEYLTFY